MSHAKPLLIELGTEELPPKALDTLAKAFFDGIIAGLKQQAFGIAEEDQGRSARHFCSPRRLAVYLPWVTTEQPTIESEVLGPAVNVGLDADGQPTQALRGFATKNGVAPEQLERIVTDKGERFVHRSTRPGQPLANLLPQIVEDALKGLPVPRPMRWSDHDYSFVRPAHWLVMLHGETVIPASLLGLESGRLSRGHRFMHPQAVSIDSADSWLEQLRGAKVLADPVQRRQRVSEQVSAAGKTSGGQPRLSDELLDEIANLTEWPVAVACAFDREFLEVPAEALVTTMETNQKFVPTFDADSGRLSEHFIGVANIESRDPAEIRKGYERVIRPRFADAKFFWDEDLKTPLTGYQPALAKVTYQQSLGSLWDKTVRVAELARIIAGRSGVDAGAATRAASLSKCDLLTRMVGEFPELQGVMGRYYAQHHGESREVALALDEHYRPRFAGDAIASDRIGQILAVADRLDTLAGIFAVGLKPSGNKDPFALRRAALGLARTLIESGLVIDLPATLIEALELIPEAALIAGLKPAKGKPQAEVVALDAGARRQTLAGELFDFVQERLRGYYADQGFSTAAFDAVLAVRSPDLVDFDRRLRAISGFAGSPAAASLIAAQKRVSNILRKSTETEDGQQDRPGSHAIRPELFESPAEAALADILDKLSRDNSERLRQADYVGVLERLALLQGPVDGFFDEVMVNAENPAVRANRLALLESLQQQLLAVADISRL
ncbi:glycine--tRNA ligase subunit beta [Frateuria aurantia]|uniref:Glycine--tRNA ligase beta subunit n=1 Tax=Frateuria aurantia (strain ATCC 33424 / DSM 6220 / KCTC 2777 / LMG 1558 / NBRC 3245 / NCIMB 13370) TaxID=767434 RepID=H8L0N0_FRAAD|nr:glycine--tRNA ligase subunit beta [Frateuria aurantia]AFC84656.1 glycyl-tRNA synthetase, tetrameric type, beta subunit [Frateuria aurantia DSM 6220]